MIALELLGHIELPAHKGKGGFDHAAVHAASGRVYVAHTANDAVDVFGGGHFLFSVPGLASVAGALVSGDMIFSSNRGEHTVGIFGPEADPKVAKVPVGPAPNGLAYDPGRKLLLAAGIDSITIVDVESRAVRAQFAAPGRTRWTVFDEEAGLFFVNVMDPAVIVVVDAKAPDKIAWMYAVPSAGPHGLDLDPKTRRLFCACDSGALFTLDARSGRILGEKPLSGGPDVIFFNAIRRQLYVAVGDPGALDVFDTREMTNIGRVDTERGAHTTALSPDGERLYVFLPATHRAAVYRL